MPYNSTTGKVYVDTTTTPHTGISMADIQAAVNDSHGDIGGLITHGEINKYAMYKPFRAPSPGFLSDSARDSELVAAGYGISTTSQRTVSAFLSAFEGGTFEWVYERPRGASYNPKEWFRMLDFNGYNANAQNPCGTFKMNPSTGTVDRNGGTIRGYMDKHATITEWPSDGLTITEIYDDVGSARTYYFGFLMKPVDSSEEASYGYRLITDNVSIYRDEDVGVDLDRGDERMIAEKTLSSTFPATTWRCYPFLTDVPLVDGQGNPAMLTLTYSERGSNLPNGMRLYPLAEAVYRDMQVVRNTLFINPTAVAMSVPTGNLTNVRWSFVITNNTTSDVTLTGGTLKFRLSGKAYADPITNEEKVVSLSTINSEYATVTVPHGESKRIPFDSMIIDEPVNKNTRVLWVGYMRGSTQITGNTTYFVPVNPYDNNLEVEP